MKQLCTCYDVHNIKKYLYKLEMLLDAYYYIITYKVSYTNTYIIFTLQARYNNN